jgi:hypothetical protein
MYKFGLILCLVVSSLSAMDQKGLKDAVQVKQVEKSNETQADEANSNLRRRCVHLAKAGAYSAGAYTAGIAGHAGATVGLLSAGYCGCAWLTAMAINSSPNPINHTEFVLAVVGSCCCAACSAACGYCATAACCSRAVEHGVKAAEIRAKTNIANMER